MSDDYIAENVAIFKKIMFFRHEMAVHPVTWSLDCKFNVSDRLLDPKNLRGGKFF